MAYNPFRDDKQTQSTQTGRVNPFRQTSEDRSDRERVMRNWQSDAEQHGILNNPQYTDEGKAYQQMAQEYARYGTQYQNQLKQGVTGRQWQQDVSRRLNELESQDNKHFIGRIINIGGDVLQRLKGVENPTDLYKPTSDYDKQIAALRKEKEWADYFADAGLRDEEGYHAGVKSGRTAYESFLSSRSEDPRDEMKRRREAGDMDLASYQKLHQSTGDNRSAVWKYGGTAYKEPQNNWTASEKNDFYYLYSQNADEAEKYAERINNKHNAAAAQKKKDAIAEWSTKNAATKALGNVAAVGLKMTSLVDTAERATEYSVRGTVTQKADLSPADVGMTITSAIGSALNEKYGTIDDSVWLLGGKGLGDAYELGASVVDSLASLYAFGPLGTYMNFFGQASKNAYEEAVARGLSVDKALTYSYAAGAAEVAGEIISIDHLIKMKNPSSLKGIIKNIFVQGGIEASEESATTLMNTISDAMINGDKSELASNYYALIQAGYEPGEAQRLAISDWTQGILYDALGGFASGFASGGIQSGVQGSRRYAGDAQQLMDYAKSEGADTAAAQRAARYESRVANGKGLTNYQAGTLSELATETITAKDMENIRNAAGKRLEALGETNVRVADAVARQAVQQEAEARGVTVPQVTAEQRKLIARSKAAQRVLSEMDIGTMRSETAADLRGADSTPYQRSNSWAKGIETRILAPDAYGVRSTNTVTAEEKRANVTVDGAKGKVVGFKDGKIRVEVTENGKKTLREAAIDEVEGLPQQTRKLFTAMEGYSGETQAAMYAAYLPGQDIERYVQAADLAINLYGALSKATLEQARSVGKLSLRALNDTQLETLMQAGRKAAAKKKAAADEQRTTNRGSKANTAGNLTESNFSEAISSAERADAARDGEAAVIRDPYDSHGSVKKVHLPDGLTLYYAPYSKRANSGLFRLVDSEGNVLTESTAVNADISEIFDEVAAHSKTLQSDRSYNETAAEGKQEVDGGIRPGKVSYDGGEVGGQKLKAASKEAIDRMSKSEKALAKAITATGVSVVFYESEADSSGKYHGAQGIYRNGTVYIDVNAGLSSKTSGQRTIVLTAAHELTHFIREFNEAGYAELREYITGKLFDQGADIEELIARKMARETREMSYDDAMEEVIADACEMMLTDPSALSELASDHSGLAKKISKWLNDFMAKLKNAFTGLEAAHDEAKAMTDYMDELRTMWGSALSDAARGMASKNAAETGDGKTAYSYRGVNDDGIEVYETSAETKKLPYSERVKRYAEIMRNEYRGRTAKFMRNGHAYYALFSSDDVRKDTYGDKRSDRRGQRAKINVGAEGNIFELVENAKYIGSRAEQGKKSDAHKNVKYWDYFVKQVQIDGRRYDVLANVRKRSDNSYVYSIQVTESKKIRDTAARESSSENGFDSQMGVVPSDKSIRTNGENVNAKSEKNSARDVAEDNKTAETYFGRTYRISEAGYLLRNGHLLDFSGRHEGAPGGYRTVDHRDISDAFDGDYGSGEYGDAMIQFMRAGNIRLSPESGGINLSVKPTESQFETLERYIQSFRGEVMLDIDNEVGDTVASVEYGRGTRSSTVLTAINDYFDSGVIPESTEARYSTREIDGQPIAWIENSGLSSKDLRNYKKVAEYIGQHIGEVYTIIESGQRVYIGEDLPREYTQSEYTKRLLKNQPDTLRAKNKAASVLGDMIEIASGRRWERTQHTHNKDAKYGMYRYNSRFAFATKDAAGGVNVHAYDVELLIRNASDGKKYLYDIVNIKKNTAYAIELQQRESRSGGIKAASRNGVSENSIRAKSENVNTEDKYSMRDVTEGDTKQELAERKKAYAQLRRENAALKARVDYLKGQTKLTKEATVRETDTAALAKRLLKDYTSIADSAEIQRQLQELGNYIVQNDGRTLSYDEIRERADSIAERIAADAFTELSPAQESLAEYTEYLKITPVKITDDTAVDFADGAYSEISRRIKLRKDGRGVDGVWRELQRMFGEGEFPSSIYAQSDMLRIMDSKLSEWAAIEGNPFANHMGEAINSAANDIMEAMLGADVRQTAATSADKAEARRKADVAAERAHGNERIERLQGIIEDERAKRREAVAREKAEKWAKVDAVKRYYQDMMRRQRADREENAGKAKYRARVEKRTKELSDWLLTNSDKQHVPEVLKKTIGDFLSALDFASARELNGGESTQKAAKFRQRLGALRDELTQQADVLNENADVDTFAGYLDVDSDTIDALSELVRDVDSAIAGNAEWTVNRMSAAELEKLDHVLEVLQHSVKNMNRLLANAHFKTTIEAAQNTMTRMNRLRTSTERAAGIKKFLAWDNITPVYAFRRFGEGGKAVFDSLTRGWDKMAFNMREIVDFAESAYKAEEVRAWEKEIREITLTSGEKVRMPVSAMMELYVTAKQEQAMNHLNGAGMRVRSFESGRTTVNQTESYLMTADDVALIGEQLTDRQRAVADALQLFTAETGAEWGNEVSMKRYGYRAFTEENYWPIATDSNSRQAVDEKARENDMFRLLNMSMTKGRNRKANNALVVGSIFDTFSSHMADMAKYNALALPILDMMKWYNYREKTTLPTGQIKDASVQKSIEGAYGTAAKNYITTLLKDINGTQEMGRGEGLPRRLISNYKVAAVAANLRVALLQPTSYVRAAMELDARYLARGAVMKGGVQEMLKYSGTAVWKDFGGYDTNISRNIRDQIKHDTSLGDTIKEKSMIGAELGDRLTWGALWNACKLEVQDKQHLRGDALMQATADRFREVIYLTQVMDSTLTRSHNMRSKSTYASLATAFMSEPTLSYSMVEDAFADYLDERRLTNGKAAWQKVQGKFMKALSIYAASAAASAIVESIADAWRDDDDYQSFVEKLLEAMFGTKDGWFLDGNLVGDLSVTAKLPLVKDIWSMLGGYSSDRMDLASIQNLIKAGQIWWETIGLATGRLEKPTDVTYNGKMTWYGKLYNTLKPLSQLTGFAGANLMRETAAIWNNTIGAWTSKKMQTYYPGVKNSVKYAYQDGYLSAEEAKNILINEGVAENENEVYFLLEEWDSGKSSYSRYNAVKDAAKAGDRTAYKKALNALTSHGVTERNAQSAVRSALKEWYQGTEDAPQSMSKQDTIKRLQDFCGMTKADAEATVLEWTCKIVTGTEYGDIKSAYLNGDINAVKAKQMLTRYGGLTGEEADKRILNYRFEEQYGFTYSRSNVQDEFIRGSISESTAKQMLTQYGGKTAEEAERSVQAFRFLRSYPEYDAEDITEAQIVKYYESVQGSGISVRDYVNYTSFVRGTSADVDRNGKAINGSKMQKVMEYIDSLNLTAQQKDVLFLTQYAESNLRKTPWH